VIEKAKFLEIVAKLSSPGLSDKIVDSFEPLVHLNNKHTSIYQVKNIGYVMAEAFARAQISENAQVTAGKDGAQVVSFK